MAKTDFKKKIGGETYYFLAERDTPEKARAYSKEVRKNTNRRTKVIGRKVYYAQARNKKGVRKGQGFFDSISGFSESKRTTKERF